MRGSAAGARTAAGGWQDSRVPVFAQLVMGAAGLVAFLPSLAVRGESSPTALCLCAGVTAPFGVAALRAWGVRPELVHATAATGVAALVLAASTGLGATWPFAIWLLAQPLNAWLSGSRNAAAAAGMVSAAAALALAAGVVGDPLPFQPHHASALALALLILWSVTEGAVGLLGRRGAARSAPAGAAPAPARDGAVDDLASLSGGLVTWHERSGEVIRGTGPATLLGSGGTAGLARHGLFERVHVPDRPAYLKALNDAANSGRIVTATFRLAVPRDPADGAGTRLAPVTMSARATGEGPAAVVAVTRDLTEAAEISAELETVRADAAHAGAMKVRFLGTVSHELRTPLNAIIGFSELLSADHPFVMAEDRRREYATIIKDSGTHLLEVVNTLLDVSKIETGNFPFAADAFSLGALVSSCCDLMGLKAEQAGIALTASVSPDLPEIVADRRACRQILINLVSNALKFTPAEGRVTVTVGLDGGRVRLSVADTGIGIREADLPRLGDPFFQAGDLHRRSHEGTGLGLSVVCGLVGLHGGDVGIESGPGLGTTVTIWLPLEAHEDGAGRPAAVCCTPRHPVPVYQRMSA